MHWIESITRALHFVESNLTHDIGVEDVADKVYASHAHFQRIFHLVTGYTIGDYLRNRRLSEAARDIVQEEKLIDVAFKYQYDTQEGFSKAFTRFHGVTPTQLRNENTVAKFFHPLKINVTIQGGFNMERNIISTIHPFTSDNAGENYWFNSAMRYVMQCQGEPDYDYGFFAGITGDNYTQFYPRNAIDGVCAASDSLMSPDYAKWVFDQVGYACEYVTEQELLANQEHYLQQIIAYIDRGLPVICVDWGVFVGYEDGGKTLLFLTHEWEEPRRVAVRGERFIEKIPSTETQRGCNFITLDMIFIGEKKQQKDLAQLHREAILRLPAQLTGGTDDYIFGAAAFRAWADDIESGKFDDVLAREGDGTWSYTNYVCVLATNGSDNHHGFDVKCLELNPDMTFLADVAALYAKMGDMWMRDKDCLEKLGGGFNISKKTLDNKRKRAKIVAKIREFADVTDEVVRIIGGQMS
ncbi:MAG: AraC family transcriptional regulator [Oscillospiraceae bacterium]|nr:AraC family transcriptional regulator [Oscillospiraceae bacterium]